MEIPPPQSADFALNKPNPLSRTLPKTMPADSALATNLAGLSLPSPVLLAAGTAGTLDELAGVLDLSRIGALVTKSITKEPREGNSTWRVLECRAPTGGMLNAIGLANVGIDAFLREVAPRIPSIPCRVIASVAGFSIDDYAHVVERLATVDALAAIELNVSCPNVHGGTEFGVDAAALADLIRATRAITPRTRLFAKLSPIAVGQPGIAVVARAAIEPANSPPSGPNQRPGVDALTISNTLPAMAIDVFTRRPRLANITGGLSGPAIRPVVIKLVYDTHRLIAKSTNTPIIAAGGVISWEDAAEYILAGATAVQIGTGLFANPRAPIAVNKGLGKWVRAQGRATLQDLIGALDTTPSP